MKFTVTQRADRNMAAVSGLNVANVNAHVVEADSFDALSSVVTFYDKERMPVAAFSDWISVKAAPAGG